MHLAVLYLINMHDKAPSVLIVSLKRLRCRVFGHRMNNLYPKIAKVWEKWEGVEEVAPYYFLVDKQTTMIHDDVVHVLCKRCDQWQTISHEQLTK